MIVLSIVTYQEDKIGFPYASTGDDVGSFYGGGGKIMQQLNRMNR